MNVQSVVSAYNETKDNFIKSYNELMKSEMMLMLATILAYIVGVSSFIKRAITDWYNNGGKDLMISNTCKVLMFVNKIAEKAYYKIEESETVTV